MVEEQSNLREQSSGLMAQWRNEKAVIDEVRAAQEKIESLKGDAERAQRIGDLTRASQITYGDLPDAMKSLEVAKDQLAVLQKNGAMLKEEVTEEEVYSGGDIYGKGSFFMHSLRYLIGDEVFLPTLKTLATDSKYTYDNFVTTTDVEKLFSSKAGKDLKPFFDFYLRTTQVLDINIKEIGFQKYQIKVGNLMMPMPFEVTANDKTSRIVMDNKGLIVNSVLPPQVDAKGFYLKKVTLQ